MLLVDCDWECCVISRRSLDLNNMRVPISIDHTPKAFIVMALAFELAILILYSVFGNTFLNDNNLWDSKTTSSTAFYYHFLMNLNNIYFGLVLLAGFALVLVYLKHSSWGAIAFSLLITAICVQLYPLVSTFWNSTFVNGFNDSVVVLDPVFSMNGCVRVSIAMLVVLAALIGRIGLVDTFLVGVVGTIIYCLNISLNICIAKARSSDANINDVGGAIDVFLFGGIFGAVIGRFIRSPHSLNHPRYTVGPGNESPVLALVGTMFIWCGFFYMSVNDPINQQFMGLGVMNTILCMSACVVTIWALAAIIHLRVGIFETVFGTISGGVIVGSCSMIIVNPAVSILLGVIGGGVTYLYLHLCHKFANMRGVIDSTGVIGVYIVNGILSPLFSCLLIAFYATFPTYKPLFLGVTIGVDGGYANAVFQLIHLGITMAIALLAGIFMGIVMRFINRRQYIHEMFDDSVDFGATYQLTTMQIMVMHPSDTSKVMLPYMEMTANQFVTPMPPGRPMPLQPIQNISPRHISIGARPMTPPKQNSSSVQPGTASPLRNHSPVQIRSILYPPPPSQLPSLITPITTVPPAMLPYRPPSTISRSSWLQPRQF